MAYRMALQADVTWVSNRFFFCSRRRLVSRFTELEPFAEDSCCGQWLNCTSSTKAAMVRRAAEGTQSCQQERKSLKHFGFHCLQA